MCISDTDNPLPKHRGAPQHATDPHSQSCHHPHGGPEQSCGRPRTHDPQRPPPPALHAPPPPLPTAAPAPSPPQNRNRATRQYPPNPRTGTYPQVTPEVFGSAPVLPQQRPANQWFPADARPLGALGNNGDHISAASSVCTYRAAPNKLSSQRRCVSACPLTHAGKHAVACTTSLRQCLHVCSTAASVSRPASKKALCHSPPPSARSFHPAVRRRLPAAKPFRRCSHAWQRAHLPATGRSCRPSTGYHNRPLWTPRPIRAGPQLRPSWSCSPSPLTWLQCWLGRPS